MAEETKILPSSVKTLGKHLKEGQSPWVPSTQAPPHFCRFSFQFKEGCWHFLLPDLNREEASSFSGKIPTSDPNRNLWHFLCCYGILCLFLSVVSQQSKNFSLGLMKCPEWSKLFPLGGTRLQQTANIKKIKFPGRSLSISLQVIFPHSPLGIIQTELCPALVTNVPSPVFRNKA